MDNIIINELSKYFKSMIQEIMLSEREKYLKEHSETRGNGYYIRTPKTILGNMELEIPRTRDGNFKPSIIPERKRVTFMLDDVIRALFTAGLSSRKTGEVIRNLMGTSVSASFVSSNLEISEEVISKFMNRELTENYPVIYIDATYISLKRDTVSKESVYVVLGLSTDGRREILTYCLPGGDEKSSVWRDIFINLTNRGLRGVKMVISDDLPGIGEVIKEVFPNADHQLCWFHLKKNIKNKVRKSDFDEILKELEYVFESKNEDEAKSRLQAFINKWSKLYRYFNNLRDKINSYCYFFKFHPKLRSYFSTTNWLERCFKELKDNIRIRGYFHSEESANKFLYLFFSDKSLKYNERKLKYSNIIEETLNG
ncbi:IS256-like element ISCni1 family transposase [Calditerrivibrio nitroreducens]|uniref:Mutator family transposase n=1 Tax=Calditerrivibrio nitroreducens (strain DSM 19672 / NBRC 101217 / Yu37-1) TaxID=768670 RepID=E4TG93_CALNY|nr:IS256-like element ISCni1 family transposase [Calditerrivibrio nitroreducens]ADR18111.1 transposase mutator type [Calditerrivibrio nitroreducens DSM 19672]ADR18983.1 transposase mutator type [Calditerrivibrio nitroreducens DSM 19672]ADR19680.1 transposase mutator type [Calditerrivibrio nitroreducens DSM 19672]ADR19821.1 transposase mutator type [Calditerrivibrio nitroreducens DSM 19672]ADR19867.1 transposase mutator type [Calditerrivibrio nitroreducens DSM 19672]